MEQLAFRLLVVEDEPKVANFLKLGLEENGYNVDVAFDGYIGKKMFDAGPYDLVILDVNLPYMNGIELCRNIRIVNQEIPVIMLTALGTTKDKIDGFDSGADDYIVKPFEFQELLARIRTLLKRTATSRLLGKTLRFHDLEMNLETFEVFRSKEKIDLTRKEFLLLELLLRNKGRVLSRSEIAEKVWETTFNTGTNVIDVYINFLRRKIDKDYKLKLIHTHPGIGYILTDERNEI